MIRVLTYVHIVVFLRFFFFIHQTQKQHIKKHVIFKYRKPMNS